MAFLTHCTIKETFSLWLKPFLDRTSFNGLVVIGHFDDTRPYQNEIRCKKTRRHTDRNALESAQLEEEKRKKTASRTTKVVDHAGRTVELQNFTRLTGFKITSARPRCSDYCISILVGSGLSRGIVSRCCESVCGIEILR